MGSFRENDIVVTEATPKPDKYSTAYGNLIMGYGSDGKAHILGAIQDASGNWVLNSNATISGDVNVDSTSLDTSGLIGKSNGGDFTVTYTSSTTLTISGYSGTLYSEDIVSIVQIDSDGAVTETYTRDDAAMSVSSNVITVTGASFTSSDTFVVYTNVSRLPIDESTNSEMISNLNPDYEHTTDVEHIINSTNDDTTTIRKIIQADTYPNMSFHLKGSGGVTFTIWASNDDTADDSSDTGWVDISSTVMGVASLVDSEGIYFIDTNMIPERFMIKYVTTDATNAADAWIKKGY